MHSTGHKHDTILIFPALEVFTHSLFLDFPSNIFKTADQV